MIYEPTVLAVVIFLAFVGVTMGLSFYLGRRTKSSAGYFAAHGQIPWFINGVAFAGDYLSAASFLGICGMIARFGYDGFLYSIGFLAGWIVALFVVAEPLKRLGKFTFADALNVRFQSRGITLAVGISTLVISLFYLIPQMVGAGALIQPLLGFPHWAGVLVVGITVIVIVVTAGMVSTTWVQFLKGSLLVVFSFVLTMQILNRGFEVQDGGIDDHTFQKLGPFPSNEVLTRDSSPGPAITNLEGFEEVQMFPLGIGNASERKFPCFLATGSGVWLAEEQPEGIFLKECQTQEVIGKDGPARFSREKNREFRQNDVVVNGYLKGEKIENGEGKRQLHPVGYISHLPGGIEKTGPLNPLEFLGVLRGSEIVFWQKTTLEGVTVFYPQTKSGAEVLRPGVDPKFAGIRGADLFPKLNFISLMLALFCGTASLPHILIRYYTVKDEAAARKSTIVGIAAIGIFYVLTLYLGLGAMTSGALDLTDSNMAAPLLAKSINNLLFAIISAIAFTTVLGTVSGLILAAAGTVVHDLLKNVLAQNYTDYEQVRLAKVSSIVVGGVAIILGILFKELNVGALVGWAFSIAASANLPSLMMLLFWRRTTSEGIIAAVWVGMLSSLGWILLSGPTISDVFGFKGHPGFVPFSEPGIVTIPLGFLTLIVVSLFTQPKPVETT